MIPARYIAAHAHAVFSDDARIARWWRISRDYAFDSIETSAFTPEKAAALYDEYDNACIPTAAEVDSREHVTGHDVVAFLSLIEEKMSPQAARHLHYGLTSSDIVDNAHFEALSLHAGLLSGEVGNLLSAIAMHASKHTPRAGRTHGQVADVTAFDHQLDVHFDTIHRIDTHLWKIRDTRILKSPGPTGYSPFRRFSAHNLAVEREADVVRSTQILPRDYQLLWACAYLRLACELENLALLVRAGSRSEIGELAEGAVTRRVGSSSMPFKRNPIDSEKVCGLARVARGYFTAISEGVALWDDRDLSNSSLERIVVPDLAATVEHMTVVMANVMRELAVSPAQMKRHAQDEVTSANVLQTLAQKHFQMGPVQAGKFMREHVDFRRTFPINVAKIAESLGVSEKSVKEWWREGQRIWQENLLGEDVSDGE